MTALTQKYKDKLTLAIARQNNRNGLIERCKAITVSKIEVKK